MDLRSDGLHPNTFSHIQPQRDSRSNGLHPENVSQAAQDAQKDFPRLVAKSSNRKNHCRENSVNSNHSDDEDGYDNISFIIFKYSVLGLFHSFFKSVLFSRNESTIVMAFRQCFFKRPPELTKIVLQKFYKILLHQIAPFGLEK